MLSHFILPRLNVGNVFCSDAAEKKFRKKNILFNSMWSLPKNLS